MGFVVWIGRSHLYESVSLPSDVLIVKRLDILHAFAAPALNTINVLRISWIYQALIKALGEDPKIDFVSR